MDKLKVPERNTGTEALLTLLKYRTPVLPSLRVVAVREV
jgi:hypothetical protein